MSDHQAIVEALTRLFWHVDHHEGDRLADVLADPVRRDHASLQGGKPLELPQGEVAARTARRPGGAP